MLPANTNYKFPIANYDTIIRKINGIDESDHNSVDSKCISCQRSIKDERYVRATRNSNYSDMPVLTYMCIECTRRLVTYVYKAHSYLSTQYKTKYQHANWVRITTVCGAMCGTCLSERDINCVHVDGDLGFMCERCFISTMMLRCEHYWLAKIIIDRDLLPELITAYVHHMLRC